MIGALLVALALAAAPAGAVPDPTIETATVQADYAAWAKKKKIRGDAAELACMPFADTLSMCFTYLSGDTRGYYTKADGKTPEELLKAGAGTEEAAVDMLEADYVDGLTPRYFIVTANGRAHTAMLFPEALERKLGGKCVVGVPAQGVLIAWVPGDLDFDKVMAVGVKRAYDTQPNPVTPTLYTYDGKRWLVWGEVREIAPAEKAPE